MMLEKERIKEIREYYKITKGSTRAQEDMFEALDTIESQSAQIEQLQAKIYQPGNCYMCKISMQNEERELIHETDMEEIEKLQAQVEKCKSEMAKIPYRCGWYDGVGLECTNKDLHKVNYCPYAICLRHKTPEATEKNSVK
jgi:DNA repair exonuclease SbcCD ATPase subunit